MRKRIITAVILVFFALITACGGEYSSQDDDNPAYPDSVYGKARYGEDKFN